jgi:hypothetical protein
VRPAACEAVVRSGGRIRPGEHEPDRQRVGPGVFDPPFEHPDRQRARLEVTRDDRGELLADDPHPEAGILGLECLPGSREQCVVGAAAHRQIPAPGRQVSVSQGRQHDGPARVTGLILGRPHVQREPVGCDGLEAMLAHREVPAREVATERAPDAPRAETADRHAGPLAVVDHRLVDPRMADVRARHADAAAPRLSGDARPVEGGGNVGRPGGRGHFSTPLNTTPRMNAR